MGCDTVKLDKEVTALTLYVLLDSGPTIDNFTLTAFCLSFQFFWVENTYLQYNSVDVTLI